MYEGTKGKSHRRPSCGLSLGWDARGKPRDRDSSTREELPESLCASESGGRETGLAHHKAAKCCGQVWLHPLGTVETDEAQGVSTEGARAGWELMNKFLGFNDNCD